MFINCWAHPKGVLPISDVGPAVAALPIGFVDFLELCSMPEPSSIKVGEYSFFLFPKFVKDTLKY